jgi:hypothetical protein
MSRSGVAARAGAGAPSDRRGRSAGSTCVELRFNGLVGLLQALILMVATTLVTAGAVAAGLLVMVRLEPTQRRRQHP